MTFDELLAQIAYDYLHPEEGQADRNGHTRLADLQEKYHLSSLKVQKLLVTAGVYEPVKTSTSYYQIKRLAENGKTVHEIMAETGLSKAAVNAFLPYERGAKELDKLGVEISSDAVRKRRQKNKEATHMENARTRLVGDFSDESFWYTLGEHDKIIFITADGQRFYTNALHIVNGHEDGTMDVGNALIITPVDSEGKIDTPFQISKAEALSSYHRALELKAEDRRVEPEDLGEYGRFLLPILVFLGVLEGDRGMYTTRRNVKEDSICSCCGRKEDRLFPVSSFADLCNLQRLFDKEREESWSDRERQMASILDVMGITTPHDEHERKRTAKEESVENSKAVIEFNMDGERQLCEMCAGAIYYALVEGDIPAMAPRDTFDSLPEEIALDYILKTVEDAEDSYTNIFGYRLLPEHFDNRSYFLFKAIDREGITHSFELSASVLDHRNGDKGFGYRALEVHKLTKAGRIAEDNAWTDYDISHFKLAHEGENFHQKMLAGMLELEEKVRNVLMMSSLDVSESNASNLITVRGKHYSIGSKGQIIPTPVGNDGRFHYVSRAKRDWPGDEYGFLIDGILFSGEELAMLCSSNEAAQIRFSVEDPSGEPLRNDEYLMPVRLSGKVLVNETIDLINMFTADGRFEREKDKENFRKLFTGVVEKLKNYYQFSGRGYGKLAGMEMVKKLRWIEGMDTEIERIQDVLRD